MFFNSTAISRYFCFFSEIVVFRSSSTSIAISIVMTVSAFLSNKKNQVSWLQLTCMRWLEYPIEVLPRHCLMPAQVFICSITTPCWSVHIALHVPDGLLWPLSCTCHDSPSDKVQGSHYNYVGWIPLYAYRVDIYYCNLYPWYALHCVLWG
jgi:hypothetical protein